VPTAPTKDPVFVELTHARGEMTRAVEAILAQVRAAPLPAAQAIRAIVEKEQMDESLVQKALIAAVRRGQVRMDQQFKLTLAS
jgi:hypothetical protein